MTRSAPSSSGDVVTSRIATDATSLEVVPTIRSTMSRKITLPPASRWYARSDVRGSHQFDRDPKDRLRVTQCASTSARRRAASSPSS